jgi:hypothetical protein
MNIAIYNHIWSVWRKFFESGLGSNPEACHEKGSVLKLVRRRYFGGSIALKVFFSSFQGFVLRGF